jgi:uncharacterized membrane protein
MQYLKIYFVAITVCFTTIVCAQTTKKYSHNSLAEKIYLQLDSEIYTNNKTIWFKSQAEFNKLIDYLNNGEKNELYDLMFKLQKRGDINGL